MIRFLVVEKEIGAIEIYHSIHQNIMALDMAMQLQYLKPKGHLLKMCSHIIMGLRVLGIVMLLYLVW